jgi:hypothetical protein
MSSKETRPGTYDSGATNSNNVQSGANLNALPIMPGQNPIRVRRPSSRDPNSIARAQTEGANIGGANVLPRMPGVGGAQGNAGV